MTLYELKNEFVELLEMLEEAEEIDEQIIKDTLEGVEGELEIKAEQYAIVMKELDAQAQKFDEEVKRLTTVRDRLKNRKKFLSDKLFEVMTTTQKTKFQSGTFKFAIVNNGGKQPLEIFDEVPAEYQIVKYEADNDKIREALEDGKELPFATLKERGKHLSIR